MTKAQTSPPTIKALKKRDVPAPDVQKFRRLLKEAFTAKDNDGRVIAKAKRGVYAFYDYDGEPIYVGQTYEMLSTRIQRHLTNQRTDAAAMRVLDIFEVASIEMWPLWELVSKAAKDPETKARLNAVEYSVYINAIKESKFKAILNEKIPPKSDIVALPESHKFDVVDESDRADRDHPDVRLARRAETISRLADVVRERGEVSPGLRRVLVVQAMRLAFLAGVRLAAVEGRTPPTPDVIDIEGLIGSVDVELTDPFGKKGDPNDASV